MGESMESFLFHDGPIVARSSEEWCFWSIIRQFSEQILREGTLPKQISYSRNYQTVIMAHDDVVAFTEKMGLDNAGKLKEWRGAMLTVIDEANVVEWNKGRGPDLIYGSQGLSQHLLALAMFFSVKRRMFSELYDLGKGVHSIEGKPNDSWAFDLNLMVDFLGRWQSLTFFRSYDINSIGTILKFRDGRGSPMKWAMKQPYIQWYRNLQNTTHLNTISEKENFHYPEVSSANSSIGKKYVPSIVSLPDMEDIVTKENAPAEDPFPDMDILEGEVKDSGGSELARLRIKMMQVDELNLEERFLEVLDPLLRENVNIVDALDDLAEKARTKTRLAKKEARHLARILLGLKSVFSELEYSTFGNIGEGVQLTPIDPCLLLVPRSQGLQDTIPHKNVIVRRGVKRGESVLIPALVEQTELELL